MKIVDARTGLGEEELGALEEKVVEKLRQVMREYEEEIAMLVQENRQLRDVITNLQDQVGELKNRVREIMDRRSAPTL
jgi:predicted RNase H-like nuclease (RuvC/YqgF family)